MKKRIRAAAIIFYQNKLITIYREKIIDGALKKYYVIPGGGVEENESVTEAVKREVFEEIGIEIKLTNKYFYLEKENAEEYFYMANYLSGAVGTGRGPEFTNRDVKKYGTYEVILIEKNDISKINIMPPEVKKFILENLEDM